MVSEQYPSFVKRRPGSLNLWSPVVTEDWSKDVAQGHSYGREIVLYMRKTGHIPFLHHVIKAMVGHGVWSGVEVGFHQLIAMEVVGTGNIKHKLATHYGYIEDEPKATEAAT